MVDRKVAYSPVDIAAAESLVVENLSRGNDHPAFSLTVVAGSCVAISGPSGSGKSTLLRLIADLDPGTGTARVGDLKRETIPANQWRRLVTYVAADSGWWTSPVSAHMSDPDAAQHLLAELGMSETLMKATPENISSGERQRLALVRALVQRPRFLLLDEPTSALDPESTLKVEKLLMRVKREGTGLLVVSHDPAQIARIADRRYMLSHAGLAEVTP
ncbi:ABC-type multidrug transport system ATPase subunit [Pseudochelatococcus lubricantis]|uniref:ABC-type multidrug transport system ATPase subunit n=1 Tax=Pseudochelatococcus lubricantis TaxID=1538102 RepID=A0ABX0V6Y5_9HYPH|nr:ABC-type multidrug transport system ATPase subunit [Pseudochelatococcus lubricantis]